MILCISFYILPNLDILVFYLFIYLCWDRVCCGKFDCEYVLHLFMQLTINLVV